MLDHRLSESPYLAGEAITVADIATFPWIRSWRNQGIEWDRYPHVQRWFAAIDARPGVQRGLAVLADDAANAPMDERAREHLFGQSQRDRQ